MPQGGGHLVSGAAVWFTEAVDGLLALGAGHVAVEPLVAPALIAEVVLEDVEDVLELAEDQHLAEQRTGKVCEGESKKAGH